MTDQDQPDKDQLERAFEYYPRLRKVKEYVEEHLDEPITLADAAEQVPFDPTHFSHFFRKATGITFTSWIHRKRTHRAKELLRSSHYPITTIAFEAGFQSLRTFQRVFKRQTGVSPRDYARRSR